MDDLKNSLGFRYLQETKFDEQTLERKSRLDIAAVHPHKQYAEAEKITLPTDWELDKSLREVLQYRRSYRRYADAPLSQEALAMMLWASQGISGRAGSFFLRTILVFAPAGVAFNFLHNSVFVVNKYNMIEFQFAFTAHCNYSFGNRCPVFVFCHRSFPFYNI